MPALGIPDRDRDHGSHHAGPVMELEVVKQGLCVLWEQLAQRLAWSVRRMELLRCLVGVECSPCPRGLGL